MLIEKVNLGLQFVTTVATIWLGYVGYELAKAQNQIAEVQTYGLPPTINHQANFESKKVGNQQTLEALLKVQITNNHTYPITARALTVGTLRAVATEKCGQSRNVYSIGVACDLSEVMKAGEVKFIELPVITEPFLHPQKLEFDDLVRSLGFFYYDPVLNKIMKSENLMPSIAAEENIHSVYLKTIEGATKSREQLEPEQ